MIKDGTLCIWQNCQGIRSFLNGQECTARSGLMFISGNIGGGIKKLILGFKTDTVHRNGHSLLIAFPHELHEKHPPQDETNLIKEKELEHG